MTYNKPNQAIQLKHNSWIYIKQKHLCAADSVAFPYCLRSTIAESNMALYTLYSVSAYLNVMGN